jgi:Ca-activated chloride channel family protein
MFDWRFVDVDRIHLVWAAIAIVALLGVLEVRARGALATFLSPVMQRRLTSQPSLARSFTKLGLVLASLVCGVLALMRPQARGEVDITTGADTHADVMFVLDVSRSMLAEDAPPYRLARAKAEIDELIDKLEDARVGLVVFAGRAVLACPLTPDRSFFSTVLSTIDTRSAGRGGTRIGEAIKTAVASFPPGAGAKLMVLITDGDDQDKYSVDAAKLARDAGVKILAIGLGSETGSEITLTDPQTGAKSKLMHDGKPVISKLDGGALRKIALATEGVYVPAGTAAVDLKSILQSYVLPLVHEEGDAAKRFVPAERFQWLVLAALLCMIAALWIGANVDRPVDRRTGS